MKWRNKGHEYDAVYQKMAEKRSFYLFGAGDYGRQFINTLSAEIQINGYIDNDLNKQGDSIQGKKCYSLEEINLAPDEGIIITMSQLARIVPMEQLKQRGYVENEDFFVIEEFLPSIMSTKMTGYTFQVFHSCPARYAT